MTASPQPRVCLTIAGSDPTSGAGISADLATFGDFDAYGVSVISALVDQGTRAVGGWDATNPALLARQIERLTGEIPIDAVKIGLLPTPATVDVVADALETRSRPVPVVWDPVLANGRGEALVASGTVDVMRARLLPLVTVVTPNAPELQALYANESAPPSSVDGATRTARRLLGAVPQASRLAVLVKGGHLPGAPGDVLVTSTDATVLPNQGDRWPDVHGTGCHLASAIAALLAEGTPLLAACIGARRYLEGAVASARLFAGDARPMVVHGAATRRAAATARDVVRAAIERGAA